MCTHWLVQVPCPPLTDLHVGSVQVEAVVWRVEHLSRVWIAQVARHVVRKHENNVVVRNTQTTNTPALNTMEDRLMSRVECRTGSGLCLIAAMLCGNT